MNWADVAPVASALPSLEELLLCESGIADLRGGPCDADGAVTGFVRLITLNLDGNALSDWGEVWRLRRLPRLQTLFLCNNQLTHVAYAPTAPGDVPSFAALASLALDSNRIADWPSIDALAGFPCLAAVRLQRNPLFERRPGGPLDGVLRYLTIARAGDHLRVLNKTEISAKERTDAELYYRNTVLVEYNSDRLRQQQQQDGQRTPQPANTGAGTGASTTPSGGESCERPAYRSAAFYRLHPRWDALLARYGEPPPTASSGPGTADGTLAAQLLDAELLTTVVPTMLPSLAHANPRHIERKRLPLSMRVGRLKQLMCTWMGVDPRLPLEVAVRMSRDDPLGQPLTDEEKPLGAYGLWNQCILVLQEASTPLAGAASTGTAAAGAIEAAEARYQASRREVAEQTAAYAQAAKRS